MQQGVETFRVSFWRYLGYIVLGISVLALPAVSVEVAVIATLFPGIPLEIWLLAIAVAFAVAEALAALAALGVVSYFKVYAGPAGLRSYNSLYLYREVAWVDVLSARPHNLFGLRSLRLTIAGARFSLWLPPFLNARERFHSLVIQYAGPEHPLAIALNEDVC